MSKFGKRITAVLMSALMTVSCIGTAFAEEAEKNVLDKWFSGGEWHGYDYDLSDLTEEQIASIKTVKVELSNDSKGGNAQVGADTDAGWEKIEFQYEAGVKTYDCVFENTITGKSLQIACNWIEYASAEWVEVNPGEWVVNMETAVLGVTELLSVTVFDSEGNEILPLDDDDATGDDGDASGDDGDASGDDGEATGDDADEYDVTVTIIGGDVSGIDLSIESGKYSGELEFTAQSEKAAKLFYTTDDGKTYEALAAEATDDEDTYSFAIDVDQDLEIIAVLSGDFNGDGKVNSTDAKQVQRADAEVTTADAFQKLASDVNGDGKFNSTDAKQIQRADAEVTTLGW